MTNPKPLLIPGQTILGPKFKTFIFCSLHACLRMTEQLLKLTAKTYLGMFINTKIVF